MIINDTLTYASAFSSPLSREISAPTLNLFVIAAVTTLLCYQSTALFSDLLLGFKPRRQASVSALHTLLLIRRSSPLAVLVNLFRSDALPRLYYNRAIPPDATIARENARISTSVVIRLLLLLLAAPLFSVISVVLTLSSESTLSFSEAGFSPVAAGLSVPGAVSVKGQRTTHECTSVPLETGPGDSPLSEFGICFTPMLAHKASLPETEMAGISIQLVTNSSLFLSIHMDKVVAFRKRTLSVHVNDVLYILKPHLTDSTVRRFVDFAMDKIAASCDADRSEEFEFVLNYKNAPEFQHVSARFLPCHVETPKEAEQLAREVLASVEEFITFVPAEKLMVAEYKYVLEDGNAVKLPYVDGSDLPLVTRRRRYLSLTALAILTSAIIVFRLLLRLVCNNDVGVGMERTVKATLGVRCCDSVANEREIVCYSSKCQAGQEAHYGLPHGDMPEVDLFHGGTVGLRGKPQYGINFCEDDFTGEQSSADIR